MGNKKANNRTIIKMRKLRFYCKADSIEVENDFKKAKGFNGSRHETNSMLASRDYSIECKTSTQPLMVVEGVWIWWCKTHRQPLSHCRHYISEINSKFGLQEILFEINEDIVDNAKTK